MADKLATYRQQLAQVEAAIAQDPDNQEWTKLRNDLLEVIELTSELAQVKASTGSSKDHELKTYSVGEKCQAIFEQDGSWYNAKIVALAEDGYFVTFLGYGNTAQVDFNEVRPYQRPDTSSWTSGTEVSAVFSGDGRWYDATVVDVKASTAIVSWKGEDERAEVEIDYVKVKVATMVDKKREEEKARAEEARRCQRSSRSFRGTAKTSLRRRSASSRCSSGRKRKRRSSSRGRTDGLAGKGSPRRTRPPPRPRIITTPTGTRREITASSPRASRWRSIRHTWCERGLDSTTPATGPIATTRARLHVSIS